MPVIPNVITRRPVIDQLSWMWQSYTGNAQPQAGDDFFDSGASSLDALRLVADVNAALSLKLTEAAVFESPTFARFVTQVVDNAGTSSLTTRLWPNAGNRSVVYMPSAWGLDYAARDFLLRLERESYLIRMPGLEPGESTLDSVSRTRQFVIDQLSTYSLVDPVFVGYSAGAKICHEVAVEYARGHQGVMAVLLDPGLPEEPRWRRTGTALDQRDLVAGIDYLLKAFDPDAHVDHARLYQSVAHGNAERALADALNHYGLFEPDVFDLLVRRLGVFMASARATRSHSSSLSGVDTILVSGNKVVVDAWGARCADLRVCWTDAAHHAVLGDVGLTEQLRTLL